MSEFIGTATYSPDDNKCRLYPFARLDKETYNRVKAHGFKWAPRQELFVAPMWTPAREDLLTELCGEIGDEDTSLVERAEARADRFEDYSDKRLSEANAASKNADEIAERFYGGQPILVGHHSEKRARKDQERIHNSMRKAVKLWDTSKYWTQRAAGALAHAKYKELPTVRARRIKTIEADKRKVERSQANSLKQIKAWQTVAGINDPEKQRELGLFVANHGGYWSMCFPLDKYPRNPPASQYEGEMGLWSAIDGGVITAAQAAAIAIPAYERALPHQARWIAHYENRLAYERALLEESGATSLLAPKPRSAKALAPLLNYRAPGGTITAPNMYDRNREITYSQVDMTAAEYAKINKDYKGTRWSTDKTHRFRTAMVRHNLVAVFLTDSKVHPIPTVPTAAEFVAENVARPESSPFDSLDSALSLAAEIAAEEPTAAASIAAEVGETLDDIEAEAALAAVTEIMAEPQPAPGPVAVVPDAPSPAPLPDAADSVPADPGARFEAMRSIMKGGGVQVVVAPQLFPTSAELAAEVAEAADLEPGQRILEPSAGTGALIEAARAAAEGLHVVAVEINPQLARALADRNICATVINADFLDMAGATDKFDRIVMNPPFERGADIRHIEHARKLLRPGGRLVSICADGPRQRQRLQSIASEYRSLPPGSFKAAGTMVNTALVVIDAPPG